MPDHDTTAVLAHHLGRLGTDACAAFVADLWNARGYETSRDGEWVVVTRDGTTLRIRIGTSNDPTDPPDLIVSPRGGRRARAAAMAADARLVDADALAEMLRYAVDRKTATALCERHLGTALEDLRPPLSGRLRARLDRLRGARLVDATGTSVSPAPSPGTVPVSGFGLVVVLLVGAIVGVALTGTPGDVDAGADVEPPPVPESTPVGDTDVGSATGAAGADGASVVPGLSDEGVSDPSALATAHARNLLGRSYTLWMDTYRPSPEDRDGPPVQFDTDVAVAGRVFLVEENVGDDEDRRRLRTVYYNGVEWFVASETAEGTTYERLTLADTTPPPAPNPDRVARELVTDYLSTPVTTVEGPLNGTDEEGRPTRYRVVGRGVPSPMDGDGVENYTAVALVDRDGLVRDLTVTYTVVAGTERYRVRKEWTYGTLGETAVRPPAWYVERFTPNVTAPPRTAD